MYFIKGNFQSILSDGIHFEINISVGLLTLMGMLCGPECIFYLMKWHCTKDGILNTWLATFSKNWIQVDNRPKYKNKLNLLEENDLYKYYMGKASKRWKRRNKRKQMMINLSPLKWKTCPWRYQKQSKVKP